MSLGPAPFEPLERGYCTICRVMKYRVPQGVCAQCRDTPLAEAKRLLEKTRSSLAEASREIHTSALVIRDQRLAVERYQRLVTFLANEDWCEEVVSYATPQEPGGLWERCEALVKAGATGVAADSREIIATWHSKAARKAYEESK